ncbi:MAG: NADH-quinone oxidoreductase subunit A [Nitrososphaerales archaeon]
MAPLIDFNAFITFLLALTIGIGTGIAGYIISRLITPLKYYDSKFERFECANPAVGKGRGWFMMQYYSYLIIFLTIEPIMIYCFVFFMVDRILFLNATQLFIIILLMIIPPLIFGLDASRRLELWRSGEVTSKEMT